MRKLVLIVFTSLILLKFSPSLMGEDIQKTFEHANDSFWAGKYDEAVKTYKTLFYTLRLQTPQIAFNLAMAFYKKGEFGRAVYFLRKALKLKPEKQLENKILKAIKLVKKTIVENAGKDLGVYQLVYADTDTLWQKWCKIFSYPLLTVLIIVSGIGFFLFYIIARRKRKWFYHIFHLIFFGLLVLFTLTFFSLKKYENTHNTGILLPNKVIVKESFLPHAPAYSVPGGVEVKITEEHESYFKVKFPTGAIGFVKKEDIGIL